MPAGRKQGVKEGMAADGPSETMGEMVPVPRGMRNGKESHLLPCHHLSISHALSWKPQHAQGKEHPGNEIKPQWGKGLAAASTSHTAAASRPRGKGLAAAGKALNRAQLELSWRLARPPGARRLDHNLKIM